MSSALDSIKAHKTEYFKLPLLRHLPKPVQCTWLIPVYKISTIYLDVVIDCLNQIDCRFGFYGQTKWQGFFVGAWGIISNTLYYVCISLSSVVCE